MRTYLQISNLAKAVALGGCITILSIPRLIQGGTPHWLYITIAFLSLTLMGGAVGAWGTCAGMVGPFPAGRRLAIGLAAGLIAGLILLPVFACWLDPLHKEALVRSGDARQLSVQFPDTTWKQFAIVLWVSGFQVLFFCAATMSLFSRVTGRWPVALVLAIALRLYVTHRQFSSIAIDSPVPFYAVQAVAGVIG